MIKNKNGKVTIRGNGRRLKADLATIVCALHQDFASVSDSTTASTAILKSVMRGIEEAMKEEGVKDDL